MLYVIQELAYHESWYGEFDRSHIDKIHEWDKKTAQEILKLIDREKLDMVVMASYGRRGHFHFGSVAEKVVKNPPLREVGGGRSP